MTSETPARPASNRFHGVDMLRGVAAIFCMLYHVQMENHAEGPWLMGFLAVDLFYAFSGYVLARSFTSRPPVASAFGGFVKGRFQRLWLPYAVGTVIGAAVVLKAGWEPAKVLPSLALMLLFLPSPFIGRGVFGLNSPGWTLTFQLAADMAHALVFSRLKTGILAAVWVACAIVLWDWTMEKQWLWAGTSFGHFAFAAVRTLVSYLAGIIVWRMMGERTLPVPWWCVQVALPVLFLGGQYLPQPLFQLFFVIVACPLLILGGLRFGGGKRLAWLAGWMGAMSYPLFAVHMPILHIFRDNGWPREGAAVAALLAGIAVTVAVKRLPSGWPFTAHAQKAQTSAT